MTLEEHQARQARKQVRTLLRLAQNVLRSSVPRTGDETHLLHAITTYLEDKQPHG